MARIASIGGEGHGVVGRTLGLEHSGCGGYTRESLVCFVRSDGAAPAGVGVAGRLELVPLVGVAVGE